MGRVLFVTGRLAEGYVRRAAAASGVEHDVVALPYPVASLLTPRLIARHLKGMDISRYSMVVIPGMVRGDAGEVEREVGVPVFKGPRDAGDIPWVMRLVAEGKLSLSKTVPACELARMRGREEFEDAFRRAAEEGMERAREEGVVWVRDLPLSRHLPVRVVAEIIDAPKRSRQELARIARYYEESGADVIDIGMVAGECNAGKVGEIVEAVRRGTRLPISIDTLDVSEIEAAIRAGVDMVISLDLGNIDAVHDIVKDVCCVLIPYDHSEGYFPSEPEERVSAMEEMARKADRYGLRNVLFDLVLDPLCSPGLLKSLVAFYEFSRRNPDRQLFMGIGNVTELVDADSPGANAVLVGIASELGVSAVLTTEASDKTRGAVGEAVKAARMMFVARARGVPPKDLGETLLLLKEKRRRDVAYVIPEGVAVVGGCEARYRRDPKGYFRVWVDRGRGLIMAAHYRPGSEHPDVVIADSSAGRICCRAVELGLVSDLGHAAYLGRELEKAEVALKTGRSYVQDEDIFT